MAIFAISKCVQAITTTVTMIQGIQPCQGAIGRASVAAFSAASEIANSGSGLGRQTCRNSNVQASDPIAAKTSVSA